ncbi:MAG: TRAP transporter fused permease subunit [Acidobacteriota bacterium]
MALSVFCLVEVNYPLLTPPGELAAFATLGVCIAFLKGKHVVGWVGAALFAAVGLFLFVQSEPLFEPLWLAGRTLGERAGAETSIDLWVGTVGLLLILVATVRTVGWPLPILAGIFLLYAVFGSSLPDALFPHRGYSWERIVGQTFLQSQGVFGVALQVMFRYVFLFLIFGAVLEATGATRWVLEGVRRLFRGRAGAPAKVAVLSSGLLGSLSGSAVANTATTGTFTIPMMRAGGFSRKVAAGLEAAASSGGALMPPVMGAGAYMMLEIIDPPVTYVEILRAALLPAVLYYLSLLLIVDGYSKRLALKGEKIASDAPPASGLDLAEDETEEGDSAEEDSRDSLWRYEGLLFLAGLGLLIGFLLSGVSVFRSVTVALAGVLLLSFFHRRTRFRWRGLARCFDGGARAGVALITAAAAVGVVIGVVTLTGLGTRLPAMILPLAADHLLLALAAIMVSAIILGMGLPSAVCYLLLATLVGPVLGQLGVPPLAAHLFIFYFGMMSMVTPPVALAAYAASSISGSGLLESGLAAFRFALAGFTLPYLFVFRPGLLMLTGSGEAASATTVAVSLLAALVAIVPLAAAVSGYLFGLLGPAARGALWLAALLALFPPASGVGFSLANGIGAALLVAVAVASWRQSRLVPT